MADDIELPEGLNPAQFVKDYLLKNPGIFPYSFRCFCRLVPPRQNREGTRSIIECQNEVLRASLTTYELREEEIAAREESWKGNKPACQSLSLKWR